MNKMEDSNSVISQKKIIWKEVIQLFGVFFKIGLCTFGGGLAMLPFLERELAKKRKWTTENQLLDYYAIGQSTPGIIAVNVATFVGYNRHGVLGSVFSTTGIISPSVIIITIIAFTLQNFQDILFVQKALAGINVAVAALMTQVVFSFAKKCIKNVFGVLVCIVSFISVYFFNVHSVFVILFSACAGILFSAFNVRSHLK